MAPVSHARQLVPYAVHAIGSVAMAGSLQVEALRFAYPPLGQEAQSAWVIDRLDLSAGAGEWLAIMGASDAGKTTLCLLASGLAPSLTGGTQEGHVRIAGRDTVQYPPPALATHAGLLFQDPAAQLLNPTVESEIAWGLENIGIPPAEMRLRIGRALSLFGIERLRHRSPLTLSGGEKKRVALASVLVMEPLLLVLDEPMGGLDPSGRDDVLAALSELLHERSTTILMTESDAEAVACLATRLTVLAGGRLVIDDAPRPVLTRPEQLREAGTSVPQMAQLAAMLNQRSGSSFDFLSVEEARHALVRWLGAAPAISPPVQQAESSLPSPAPAAAGEAAIETNGLWYWYADENAPVLRGVDLRINVGEIVGLVGANGSGKTTLIKHLNGLLRPRRGSVRILGQDGRGRSIGEMARSVGFLFQSPEQQIFSATVREEIAFGPRNLGLDSAAVEKRVSGALERFDLAGVERLPPAILSHSTRRRLALASLAAMEPPILVLDEPTVGLDASGRDDLVRWVREQQSAGRTILVTTHDMALLAELAPRVVVLSEGTIAADGSPAQVFDRPHLLAKASLAAPPIVALSQALRPFGVSRRCLTVAEMCDALAMRAGQP